MIFSLQKLLLSFCVIINLVVLFLLVSDCFLLTLASTGIVFGALTTEGQTETVADTAIAADIHQSLDVHLDFGAEGALDRTPEWR